MLSDDELAAPKTYRELIQFYLIDYQTPLGKLIDIVIIFLNLLICAIFVIETYPISDELRSLLWNIEIVTIIFFIIEYLARLYGAPDRAKYVVNIYSIIDLVAIVPTLLQLILPMFGAAIDITFVKTIRVFKVLRIFRFLRFFEDPHFFFGSIGREMLNVGRLIITILIIFFVFSGLFLYIESPVNDQVQNFGDALYFTVVALSTVGFGDIIPVSDAGRWVTVLMIISGIIIIPWQVSRIVREWIQYSKKKRVVCPRCALSEHDIDAIYCKHCGNPLRHEKEIYGQW
jgi:voltage-gated potassium channel